MNINPIRPQERIVDASRTIRFEDYSYDVTDIGAETGDIILVLPAATFVQQGPGVYVWKKSISAAPYLLHSLQHKSPSRKPEHLGIWAIDEEMMTSPTHPETNQREPLHGRTSRTLPSGVADLLKTKQALTRETCTADIRIQRISWEKLLSVSTLLISMNINCSISISTQEGDA